MANVSCLLHVDTEFPVFFSDSDRGALIWSGARHSYLRPQGLCPVLPSSVASELRTDQPSLQKSEFSDSGPVLAGRARLVDGAGQSCHPHGHNASPNEVLAQSPTGALPRQARLRFVFLQSPNPVFFLR